ncbi:hypothetical protein QE152_g3703 [Popillia japonica]|uniref:Uncharacterized protein n=1 Tax=Popillia japonica TaxID=7064 RepID=A0AAW1N3N4_POPJA
MDTKNFDKRLDSSSKRRALHDHTLSETVLKMDTKNFDKRLDSSSTVLEPYAIEGCQIVTGFETCLAYITPESKQVVKLSQVLKRAWPTLRRNRSSIPWNGSIQHHSRVGHANRQFQPRLD